jgi:hypothetical protein
MAKIKTPTIKTMARTAVKIVGSILKIHRDNGISNKQHMLRRA